MQSVALRVMLAAMSKRLHPGYAVAMVSTVALVLTAPGQTMLVSLLNLPLREAFDVEPLVLNTAYTAATVLAALPLVWVGRLTDRLGPRRMLALLGVCFGGACLFTASIAHAWMIFGAFFLLRFLGPGALAMVSHHSLAMWFHRKLGTLTGVQLVLLFAIWAAFPAGTTGAIAAYGWRWTWAGFGIVIALTVALLSWRFVRDRPEDLGLTVDGDATASAHPAAAKEEPGFSLAEAKATSAFWILMVASVLPPMVGTAVLFDIQPLFVARGLDPEAAAFSVSAWSITMAAMALPSGRLVDRFSPRWLIAGGMSVLAGSCAMWTIATTTWAATLSIVAFAIAQSLVSPTIGTTAARFFGRRHHGAIRSSYSRVGIIATGLGPLAFGISVRLSGDQQAALIAFALLCLPAAAIAIALAPPPRNGGTAWT